ncbi:rho GTPase-activating 39-like [Paramuricea clavata]|nr:rho GTPase-activating 39-like [Paramuricea clavata]
MSVCLAMFPPSAKYHSYLEGYVYSHLKDNQRPVHKILEQEISNRIAQYAENCQYKLEKMAKTGSRKGQRQPTIAEVKAAKRAIFNPSMFGSTLEDTMEMQRINFPDLKLPWILGCLTERIIQQNGTAVEGIFRVPGDIDEVNALKVKTDSWAYPDDCNDPNVAASLLKQWFRDLKDPLLDESV